MSRKKYPHWFCPMGISRRYKVEHGFLPAEDAGVISLCSRVQLGLHVGYGHGEKNEQPDLEDTTGCCPRCVDIAERRGFLTLHGKPVRARRAA
jgi:hypothetical protein